MTHHDEDGRVIAADAPEYNATLVKRVDYTPDLASFWVKLHGAPVLFEPGQHVTIGIVADDRIWQRPYSVASPPAVAAAEGYELYVRHVPVVRFTTLLWRLQPGARLQVGSPEGAFTLDRGDRRPLLFVASGVGIAPFLSMTWEALLHGRPRPTVLLHGVSHPTDLPHREFLEGLGRDGSYPMRYVPTVSRPEDPGSAGWRGRTGRVEKVIGAVCGDLDLRADQTVAYVCGNPDMILNAERILVERGFPEARVKKELYWPASTRPEWQLRARAKDITGTH